MRMLYFSAIILMPRAWLMGSLASSSTVPPSTYEAGKVAMGCGTLRRVAMVALS